MFGVGDRLAIGGAAGLALMTAFGPKDTSTEDKMAAGAFLGAGIGVASPFLRSSFSSLGTSGGKSIFKHFGAMPGNFASYSKRMSKGNAALKAFGTVPGFMLAGGVIGGAIGGPKGTAIGAGVGLLAKPALKLSKAWKVAGKVPGGKLAVIGALSGGYLLHSLFNEKPSDITTATRNRQTGETDYIEENYIGMNMQQKLDAIGATGDMVFGMNNRRHG